MMCGTLATLQLRSVGLLTRLTGLLTRLTGLLHAQVSSVAAAAGIVSSADEWRGAGWADAWSAICRVWASKWTERAWLSRRSRGVPEDKLYMAVLLQQVDWKGSACMMHSMGWALHPTLAVLLLHMSGKGWMVKKG